MRGAPLNTQEEIEAGIDREHDAEERRAVAERHAKIGRVAAEVLVRPALATAEGLVDLDEQIANLRRALRQLIKYARWQMTEGANHHPILPSAVAEAQAVHDEAR